MGYETKMYLVTDNGATIDKETGARYCGIVACVDLSKMGDGKLMKIDADRPSKPEVYIYGSDGNTQIIADCYGNNLGVYDPAIVLAAMKADNKREKYRRFDLGVAMLESAIGKFDRLKVLFYGH